MNFSKLTRYYRNAALVLLNTVAALIVINVVLYLAITIRYRHFHPDRDNPVMARYIDQTWAEIYPGKSEEEIKLLLNETWQRRERYSPVTQHAERAFRGHYVNVNPAGFREHSDQGPWPVDDRFYNVFLFGGSTVFGYGVSDDETIAAHLQHELSSQMGREVRVYNFGNSSFHSTPERARFEHLLMTNDIPDLAIFVDGLNEFSRPLETEEIHNVEAAYDADLRSPFLLALERLPLVRTGRAIKKRIRRSTATAAVEGDDTLQTGVLVKLAVDRYLHNVSLLKSAAAAYDVDILFIWQPVPMYDYDLARHPFARGGFPNNRLAHDGYGYFAELLESEPLDSDFVWCADMQRGLKGLLYVDKIHYSSEMNRLVAKKIAAALQSRG